MKKPMLFRQGQIARLRSKIVYRGSPRVFMLLLVTLTTGIGFLSSALLLRAGWQTMGWRYLLACSIAYGCFLAMLWIWLKLARTRGSADALTDLASGMQPSERGAAAESTAFSGKGGAFDGGGASGDVDFSPSGGLMETEAPASGEGLGDVLSSGADAGELAAPVVLVIGAAVLIAACGAVVYAIFNLLSVAPLMFAELIFDGLLAAGMYRRYRYKASRHWLETAFQHTWRPFLGISLVAGGAGFVLTLIWPEARTLGDILHILLS